MLLQVLLVMRNRKKIVELAPQAEINLVFYLEPTVLPSQTVVVTALIASEKESPVVFFKS
ncbi:hypothetical protein JGI9_01788 [Candidatus Kryptonium thompsonii]|nr:hypothetical protein JGI9_01788 [Candidatus Kryptonium thompsoni]